MSVTDKKTAFLTHYIFNPIEVDLPPGFDHVLLALNIWPKHIGGVEQKKAILAQDEFNIGTCTFYRNKPGRRSSGTIAFRYAHGEKTLVKESEYDINS